MRASIFYGAAVAALALSGPAEAGYVHATYSGSVAQVSADAPSSISVGTPITFDLVYDPAKRVDVTDTFVSNFGPGLLDSFETASLSDDPNATLKIMIGDVTFTKFSGLNYGTPCGDIPLRYCGTPPFKPSDGLGAGDLPSATYLNGAFAGVSNIFVNEQGYSLDADPVADLLQRLDGSEFGLDGPETGNSDFYFGMASASPNGDVDPFTKGYAVGNIDLSTLRVSAVPEASVWMMMIAGFGLIGSAMRMRRQRPAYC